MENVQFEEENKLHPFKRVIPVKPSFPTQIVMSMFSIDSEPVANVVVVIISLLMIVVGVWIFIENVKIGPKVFPRGTNTNIIYNQPVEDQSL
jgi:hypothetical protein